MPQNSRQTHRSSSAGLPSYYRPSLSSDYQHGLFLMLMYITISRVSVPNTILYNIIEYFFLGYFSLAITTSNLVQVDSSSVLYFLAQKHCRKVIIQIRYYIENKYIENDTFRKTIFRKLFCSQSGAILYSCIIRLG